MDYSKFTDVELLSWLVGVSDANRVYDGSLTRLFRPLQDCDPTYQKLGAAHELVKRSLEERLRREYVFSKPYQAQEYLQMSLRGLEYESFVCLFLDAQHRLIMSEEMARGTIDGAAVYPREVVKRALAHNAAAVILAHNHPSGIAEPSNADRVITQKLKDSLSLVDVRVLDHFVVGDSEVIGFADRGWL